MTQANPEHLIISEQDVIVLQVASGPPMAVLQDLVFRALSSGASRRRAGSVLLAFFASNRRGPRSSAPDVDPIV